MEPVGKGWKNPSFFIQSFFHAFPTGGMMSYSQFHKAIMQCSFLLFEHQPGGRWECPVDIDGESNCYAWVVTTGFYIRQEVLDLSA
jgi:hypothetical protein